MPIYTYKCSKCDAEVDEIRSIADRNAPLKCKCKGKMVLQISPAQGIVKNPAVPRSKSR